MPSDKSNSWPKRLECWAGPLDGKRVKIDSVVEIITIVSGDRCYLYEVKESFNGKLVMKVSKQVLMKGGEGEL